MIFKISFNLILKSPTQVLNGFPELDLFKYVYLQHPGKQNVMFHEILLNLKTKSRKDPDLTQVYKKHWKVSHFVSWLICKQIEEEVLVFCFCIFSLNVIQLNLILRFQCNNWKQKIKNAGKKRFQIRSNWNKR